MTQSDNYLSIDYRNIRNTFDSCNYTSTGILDALGVTDLSSIRGNDVELLLYRTRRDTPLNTLIRLFCIEIPCDIEAVRHAVKPMGLEEWVKAGLFEISGSSVSACLKVLPYQNLLITFDLPGRLLSSEKKDYVMGIGSSTMTLANLTVRVPWGKTLDLGTGCGFHALLAASHSKSVYGVDINPRAVHIASLNAHLNGFSNITHSEGDLFDPVQGQTFDLIVTNPPFVISPEKRYIYRDSGMDADQVCQKIVSLAPHFLNQGGYCQILCNWAHLTGHDWKDRLRTWFDGTACDVWVICSETRDIATYANTWIRHTEKLEAGHFGKRFSDWMNYYEQQGIEAISAGLITMRKSSNHINWFRAENGPDRMIGPCGDHILQGFELRDFLESVKDDSFLLNTFLKVSPDVHLEQYSVPTDDGWSEIATRLHVTKGLAFTGNIDPYVANLVVGCNGRQSLSELLDNMATSSGKARSELGPTFCNVVRGLVEHGFLLPLKN